MSDKLNIYQYTDNGIGYLVFNRVEKHNAMSMQMWFDLERGLAILDSDPAAKVIVLKSNAPRTFSAGGDIALFQEIADNPDMRDKYRLAIRNGQRAVARTMKPTIAMINGGCFGAGTTIATHCDFRFASTNSSFGITPTKIGLVYPLNDTRQLVDLIGIAMARRMLLTAQILSGDEALTCGLIDNLCDADALEDAVKVFAETIASRSQYSVQTIKKTLRRVMDGQVDDDLETAEWFNEAHEGVDFHEGVAAFLEKRAPNFKWSSDQES